MFSEKIRDLRKKTGLSQEEFAEKLDVSRQAVSKWELGTAVPTADKLVDIADFFGVSVDFLMRDGDLPKESTAFSSKQPQPPQKSKKRLNKGKLIVGILMLSLAVLLGTVVLIFFLTGIGGGSAIIGSAGTGDSGAGSGIMISGAGILAALALAAMLGVAGVVLIVLSIK